MKNPTTPFLTFLVFILMALGSRFGFGEDASSLNTKTYREVGGGTEAEMLDKLRTSETFTKRFSGVDRTGERSDSEVLRRSPVVSAIAGGDVEGGGEDLDELDRIDRIQRLLDRVSSVRGVTVSPIRVRAATRNSVQIEYDLEQPKAQLNGAFGGVRVMAINAALPNLDATSITMPAEMEYRVEQSERIREEVVAVKSPGETIASLFKSGDDLVTVRADLVGLTARQLSVESGGAPMIEVTVGAESKQMAVGEKVLFGDHIEVILVSSTGKSTVYNRLSEGPEYSVRLMLNTLKNDE